MGAVHRQVSVRTAGSALGRSQKRDSKFPSQSIAREQDGATQNKNGTDFLFQRERRKKIVTRNLLCCSGFCGIDGKCEKTLVFSFKNTDITRVARN